MNPIRWELNIAVFTTTQIDELGPPDYYGYDRFIVINDNECPMVTDYKMEISQKLRRVHHYSRVERFTKTLANLLSLRGNVPRIVLEECKQCTDWESVRTALKVGGYARYYNMIPMIMNILKLPAPITIKISNLLFHKMVHDFEQFQEKYRCLENTPKYFPSLRYIALKILQENGAEFNNFQFIRTLRIELKLEKIWEEIMFQV